MVVIEHDKTTPLVPGLMLKTKTRWASGDMAPVIYNYFPSVKFVPGFWHKKGKLLYWVKSNGTWKMRFIPEAYNNRIEEEGIPLSNMFLGVIVVDPNSEEYENVTMDFLRHQLMGENSKTP